MAPGRGNHKTAAALPKGRERRSLPEDINFYEFANSLAHEIRNPLNALALNLKLLEKEVAAGPGTDKLRAALGEVRRLDELLTAFLRFARPKKPRFVLLDVGQVIDEFRVFVAPEALKRGVNIVFDIERAGITLTDGDLLKQALLNLIINSFDAAAKNVKITAEALHSETIIIVADDGPGIAEPGKIFEPFYSTKPEGTGLGLSTARVIVRALGGELEFTPSLAGAAFTIRIPRTPNGLPPAVV